MSRFFRPRAGGVLIALFAAAALAVPGAATARVTASATVSVPSRCYASWPGQTAQTIPIRVQGLPAGTLVKAELQVNEQTVSGLPSLTTDSTGGVTTELKSWTTGFAAGPSRAAPARIVITDFLMGTELAATDLWVANVDLDIDTSTKKYDAKRSWVVSGLSLFGGGSSYYAHYFKGTKEIAKVRLGAADDTCGYLKLRRPLMPFQRLGNFIVSVQASKDFDPNLPSMSYKIRGFKK